jgi:tryptophan-rich sensory protein
MNSNVKTKILSIQHLFVALILIPKGYDKIEHHYSLIGWIILFMGLIIFVYFVYQKLTKTKNHLLAIGVHLFESIALFLTSYVYFEERKRFLPYITIIAGIGFLIATIIHITKINSRKTE